MQKMTHKYTRNLKIFYNENHDFCTNCGHEFIRGDTSHLGYLINRDFANLCDKCSYLLSETVVRYYFEKREYELPPMDAKLWRYMDFSKYVSLISKRALFFAAASKFDDIFEGAKGIANRKEIWDKHYYSFFVDAIKNPPKGYVCDKTSAEIAHEATRLLNQLTSSGELDRKRTFINCWHENWGESEAMWKLYSKDIDNAIAIQTTYKSFYYALNRDPKISIGRVNYIDFTKRFAPINGSYWYKRKSFEHEKEVRAMTICRENAERDGLLIPINLDRLIENIYLSPSAPKWFVQVVNDVNTKYNVKAHVMQSSLSELPFH